jgi:hypothetical protein
LVATLATPLLAAVVGGASDWRRPWLAPVLTTLLYLVASQFSSLAGQAAGVVSIALACLTLAAAVAWVAPPRTIAAGLVVLAVVDVILVWARVRLPRRRPSSRARHCRRCHFRCFHIGRCRRCSQQRSARRRWDGSICSRLLCSARCVSPTPVRARRLQPRRQPALGVSCSSSRRRSLRRFPFSSASSSQEGLGGERKRQEANRVAVSLLDEGDHPFLPEVSAVRSDLRDY